MAVAPSIAALFTSAIVTGINSGASVDVISRLDLGALSPIVQQPGVDAMPASHGRDIRVRLEALRQNPSPLLVAPAKLTRRPGDQLDAAIAFIAIATVIMSVIVSVILHDEIRRIEIRSR